jgi:hypothetical protein
MNSPDHSTKGTPLPLAAKQPRGLRRLGSARFQGLFHPPCGVLFTVPSRYSCTIGGSWYLALEGGPPCFPQDFSCPVVLRYDATNPHNHRLRGSHPLWHGFPAVSPARASVGDMRRPTTPCQLPSMVWALPGSLATTTGISLAFLFLGVHEMFQFPRCPPSGLFDSASGDHGRP